MPLALRVESDPNPIRRFLKKQGGLFQALAFFLWYLAWVQAFRLLVLTFITYFLMSPNSQFQDISETYGANEVSLMGLAALLFVAFLKWLHPMTSTTSQEIFTPLRFENHFLKGFLQGGMLACGVSLAFLLSGLYRYLGFFIRFDEAPLALANVVVRVAGLFALAYCEEFIFRHKIMGYLKQRGYTTYPATLLTAVLYCLIKLLQFEIGIMHLMTLFLVSVALALRTFAANDFLRGAGFWAAVLIVFHPLLSLPIFGNEFSGVLLIKYQASSAPASESQSELTRILTGGAGGPISSLAFQLVLLLDIVRGILKKNQLNSDSQELR